MLFVSKEAGTLDSTDTHQFPTILVCVCVCDLTVDESNWFPYWSDTETIAHTVAPAVVRVTMTDIGHR